MQILCQTCESRKMALCWELLNKLPIDHAEPAPFCRHTVGRRSTFSRYTSENSDCPLTRLDEISAIRPEENRPGIPFELHRNIAIVALRLEKCEGSGHRGNHKNPRLCMCEHIFHDVLW